MSLSQRCRYFSTQMFIKCWVAYSYFRADLWSIPAHHPITYSLLHNHVSKLVPLEKLVNQLHLTGV